MQPDGFDCFLGPALSPLRHLAHLTTPDMVLWGNADEKTAADMNALGGELKQMQHLCLRIVCAAKLLCMGP